MKFKLRYALLLLALPAGIVAAQAVGSPMQVRDTLAAAGYRDIHDLELDNGLWEAKVTRPDGSWGEVEVHRGTGEIFDHRSGRPLLDMSAVVAKLEQQGYSRITELDREGAVWEIDAVDRRGRHVELRVSGYDGRVLHREVDYFELDGA